MSAPRSSAQPHVSRGTRACPSTLPHLGADAGPRARLPVVTHALSNCTRKRTRPPLSHCMCTLRAPSRCTGRVRRSVQSARVGRRRNCHPWSSRRTGKHRCRRTLHQTSPLNVFVTHPHSDAMRTFVAPADAGGRAGCAVGSEVSRGTCTGELSRRCVRNSNNNEGGALYIEGRCRHQRVRVRRYRQRRMSGNSGTVSR